MLQGDAIREITLEGPGAGGIETASAVVADMVSVIGTTGTGFLQNDPVWRDLPRLGPGDLASNWYLRLEVEDRAGVLARIAQELAAQAVSVARLVQRPGDACAVLHVITHEATAGSVEAALTAIRALPESRGEASALPVVSDRGVEGLGWA
jgi:homoserine dehydrogenase